MTTKTIKAILFASLMFAMILPFSVMSFVDASSDNTNDNAGDIVKDPKPLTMEQMINDKQEPKEKHKPTHKKGEYPRPQNPANSGFSTQGTHKEYFGTFLNQNTSNLLGIFTKNEVHIGLDIKDGTTLYAPVTYPANESPIEVVTAYKDEWWTTDQRHVILYNHVTETFDWTNAFDLDQDFLDNYTVRSDGSDFYYTYIGNYVGNWKVYIFDTTNWEWDLWDIVPGSSSFTNGTGWSGWEEYNFNGNCPTLLPEIAVPIVQVYDGGWKNVDGDYGSVADSGSVCGITGAVFNSNYHDWTVDD